MEQEIDVAVRRRRRRQAAPEIQEDPEPNLDESDDENVSNAAEAAERPSPGFAAMLEDGEDTDSALDELDEDQQSVDQGSSKHEGSLDRLPPRSVTFIALIPLCWSKTCLISFLGWRIL